MTWMRNTSASRGRQSLRNARKIRFSPFWLKIRIPESILARSSTCCAGRGLFGLAFGEVRWGRQVRGRDCLGRILDAGLEMELRPRNGRR